MPTESASQITRLLNDISSGRQDAYGELTPLLYGELREMAHGVLRNQPSCQTLRTTALVHEAYLKLVDHSRTNWQSRAHFFCVAAKAMRSILVDYARKRKASKRGGGAQRIEFDDAFAVLDEANLDLIALDKSLNRLAKFDERKSRIIELRFFGGLNTKEVAQVLNVSPSTVEREWRITKAWLHRELNGSV